jgi:chitin disaccharide deacetylase
MNGLLIVNADDWGGERRSTEAIHEAFRAGRVTSTTAMVYMEDSGRAAGIATDEGLPVGLHLNLTQPFTEADIPEPVRERQRRVAAAFGGHGPDGQPGTARRRRWLYDPRVARVVGDALRDQLERFEAIYGGPPTHFDGHNYVDTTPNVFLSRALPRGAKMRSSLDRYPLDTGAGAVARELRHRLRRSRFHSTRYVLHISDLDLPDDPRLAFAATESVEVICHPDNPSEMERLMSAEWATCLARVRTGSFADLD